MWHQEASPGPAPTRLALAWAKALGQRWVAAMWQCLAPMQVGIFLQCMQPHSPSYYSAPGCCRHEGASFRFCSGPSGSCWQPWHTGVIIREPTPLHLGAISLPTDVHDHTGPGTSPIWKSLCVPNYCPASKKYSQMKKPS